MFVAELSVIPNSSSADCVEAVTNAAGWYLAAIYHHGQVCGLSIQGWVSGRLRATVNLARPDAYRLKYHSAWGRTQWRALRRHCKKPPEWKVTDDQARRSRFADWREAELLYLSTARLLIEPPIHAYPDGKPVPAYLLGLKDKDVEVVQGWGAIYRDHDAVWTTSGSLEIAAWKELVEPDSELSKWGRTLCRTIEKATGKPTYYYLHRYWGYRDPVREANRKCPGCGRKWSRVTTDGDVNRCFDFRCDRCRLVSPEATDFGDERHARIGEFRLRRRQ